MPTFYDPDNPTPLDEQNYSAWYAVLVEIRGFMISSLILILSGVISFHASRLIIARGYEGWVMAFAIVALAVSTVGGVLYLRKETIRKEIFGRPDPWTKNPGHPPSNVDRVSVEYADETKRWNIPTNDAEWGLGAENPIKTYYPKD